MVKLAKTRGLLAVVYFLLGVGVLAFVLTRRDLPPWWLVALFALAFGALEMRSVEVNDHWLMSSSIMVALTAGVVFALGEGSAAAGMAVVTAAGLATPADFRLKRFTHPAWNFGQLVVSGAATGWVLDVSLARAHVTDLLAIGVAGGMAALVYSIVNIVQVWAIVRVAFSRRNTLPWAQMPTLAVSQFAQGVTGGLMGAVLLITSPSVIPLVLIVYVVGHLAFSSYGALREAHEATLRGFVKALEAKDLYTRGHTERVAYFAQMIGRQFGFSGTKLQRLRYAALIHDVGKLAVPAHLIRKRGKLTADEYEEMQRHAHVVEDILSEVEFLQPMVEIASGHHSHFDGAGYGGRGHRHGERPDLETCILAVADAFDAMTSTRSYRMALSQDYAFRELRSNAGSQFHPEVVDALEKGLATAGETYGSPAVDSEELARAVAESGSSYV